MSTPTTTGLEIAVIGMAGRFPGAGTIHRFWENLKNGVESISFFTGRELEEAGIEPGLLADPNYVKALGYLEATHYFDAVFFGYTPAEAGLTDPQLRIYHECAWAALEDAGCNPDTYPGLIGVYSGASPDIGWVSEALRRAGTPAREFDIHNLNSNFTFGTRLSYTLNLKGPGLTVLTACSTSLSAIHLACQGLLNAECDIALAGGVSISSEGKCGYMFQEGMIGSPDGHCRAFDANAKGVIRGEGAAVVVLKRLEEALEEGDFIYAVIKGTAINNDGARKIGYTAPSVEGQAEVIKAALETAEVEAESISYVEAHGTGTALGDPIEIEGLKLAFDTDKRHFCAVGSVKSNVGHLDNAAGVTGFVKAVLALKHRQIPPSLHFESPNPGIDFENSPFYVNARLKEWKNDHYPLRAGVSSFGIGGTNAHAVLEEAPSGG
ncbi:MAG: polyketide synthase, partial [bacterium]|nr:polyketide synthase [bacterium]